MAEMVECKCKGCGKPFIARVADRKRGWGRFCSKSCKAVKQEARTHQFRNYCQRSEPMTSDERALHDVTAGWDDHKDWP